MGTTITFLFVAIINLVVKSTVNTDIALAMTTPQPPPTINYTCKTNGSIDVSFSNIVGFSKITVTDVNMVLTGNCTASDGCAKYLQPINQTMHLTDCGENQTLFIYIMKEKSQLFDQTISGKDVLVYIMSCDGEQDSELITEVTYGPVEEVTPIINFSQDASFHLTMSVTQGQVHIGDKLTLNISLDSGSSLYVLPESCDAKPEKGSSNATIHLLVNGATADVAILSNFSVTQKGQATADLYAFRFVKSSTVLLECKVHVCKDIDCGSTFPAYKFRRRRRALDNQASKHAKPTTHLVGGMFTVVEEKEKISSAQNKVVSSALTVLAMATVVHFRLF